MREGRTDGEVLLFAGAYSNIVINDLVQKLILIVPNDLKATGFVLACDSLRLLE